MAIKTPCCPSRSICYSFAKVMQPRLQKAGEALHNTLRSALARYIGQSTAFFLAINPLLAAKRRLTAYPDPRHRSLGRVMQSFPRRRISKSKHLPAVCFDVHQALTCLNRLSCALRCWYAANAFALCALLSIHLEGELRQSLSSVVLAIFMYIKYVAVAAVLTPCTSLAYLNG